MLNLADDAAVRSAFARSRKMPDATPNSIAA